MCFCRLKYTQRKKGVKSVSEEGLANVNPQMRFKSKKKKGFMASRDLLNLEQTSTKSFFRSKRKTSFECLVATSDFLCIPEC